MKTSYITFNNIKIYIEENEEGYVSRLGRLFNTENLPPDTEKLSSNSLQVLSYLNKEVNHMNIGLDVKGTPFQIAVWNILKTIPYGDVWTYKQVAQALGDEKKVRAVANAIGKNQHMILIPCHRVIGSDGKLHGFAGGLDMKEALLKIERDR